MDNGDRPNCEVKKTAEEAKFHIPFCSDSCNGSQKRLVADWLERADATARRK
jgi:endogenous inhibitor of DNA gyrase (YacG/DUF329 family)